MTVFALRLPEDLKKTAAAQAASTGVSLDQYIALAVASRVGAQAEAERYFKARGARTTPARAKEILARAGIGNAPRDDDRLDAPDDLDTPDEGPEPLSR
jgi:HicB family